MFTLRTMFVLFSLGIISLAAAICPSNYTQDSNGCYSTYLGNGRRFEGYDRCAKDGAFMPYIDSAFKNSAVQSNGQGVDKLWLGLTCLASNDVTSCMWDNGKAMNKTDFNNFISGAPDMTIGACAYMKVSNGMWYSSDCTQTIAWSTCEYGSGVKVPYCADGSVFFRGSCYMGLLTYNVDDAVKTCQKDCGTLVSIHSDGENSLVRDVGNLMESTGFMFIGLKNGNKGLYYVDGSPVNYTKFAFENPSAGTCVSMALESELIAKGKWLFSECLSNYPINTVCKKHAADNCTVVPSNIVSPSTCTSAIFINGAGTMYSPGYPGTNYGSEHCEYLITEVDGKNVSITFTDLNLDSTSTITLFNFFASAPFATLTNTKSSSLIYTSPSNMLKVVYNTTGTANNFFRAEFGDQSQLTPQSSGCNGGDIYYQGTFSTPNYPQAYPPSVDCEYRLHSDKNRIVLVFNEFLSEEDMNDYVKVFDFNGAELLTLTGGPYKNVTVSSFSSEVKVRFHSNASEQLKGFSAQFFSVY